MFFFSNHSLALLLLWLCFLANHVQWFIIACVFRGFNKHRLLTKSVSYFDQRHWLLSAETEVIKEWSFQIKLKFILMGLDVLFTSISRSRSRLIVHWAWFGTTVTARYGSTHIYIQFDAQHCFRPSRFQIFLGGGGMPPDLLAKVALWPLVNTVAYSSQTGCPLQTFWNPYRCILGFQFC